MESAGTTSADFAGDTVAEVIAKAVSAFGSDFERGLETAKVWVNGDPAGGSTPVIGTDEIALIPPVSGGTAAAQAQTDMGRALSVVALVVAVAAGNLISPEVFVFVTVGAAIAWLWDIGDALATRGSPVAIIPGDGCLSGECQRGIRMGVQRTRRRSRDRTHDRPRLGGRGP